MHKYQVVILVARRMNRHDLETAKWEARESANVFGIPQERLNSIYGYEHSSEPTLRVRTASFTAPEEELEEERQNLAQPLNNNNIDGDDINAALDSRGRPRRKKSFGRRLRDSFRLNRRERSRSTSSERIRRHHEDVEAQKAAGREYHSTFDLSDDTINPSAVAISQQSEKEQLFSKSSPAPRLAVDLPASPAQSVAAASTSSSPLQPNPTSPANHRCRNPAD